MTACTSAASSGDSLFEGPSISADAPEFSCVAAQPASAINMITIAANDIDAASRLRSSTCTSLPRLRFTQHLFQSQRISEREVIWLWQVKILPAHRHGSPQPSHSLSGTLVQKSREARQEPCSITAAPP